MAKQPTPINNPLTLIALFAGLAETCAAALPFLDPAAQSVFIWFVMLFSVLIATWFFLTLNFNHRVLYARGDYADEKHFLEIAKGRYTSDREIAERLKRFWKPDGWINEKTNVS